MLAWCLMTLNAWSRLCCLVGGWGFSFCVVWRGRGRRGCGLFFLKKNCPYHTDLIYDMISIKPDSLYVQDCTRIGFLRSPPHLNPYCYSSPAALALSAFSIKSSPVQQRSAVLMEKQITNFLSWNPIILRACTYTAVLPLRCPRWPLPTCSIAIQPS